MLPKPTKPSLENLTFSRYQNSICILSGRFRGLSQHLVRFALAVDLNLHTLVLTLGLLGISLSVLHLQMWFGGKSFVASYHTRVCHIE